MCELRVGVGYGGDGGGAGGGCAQYITGGGGVVWGIQIVSYDAEVVVRDVSETRAAFDVAEGVYVFDICFEGRGDGDEAIWRGGDICGGEVEGVCVGGAAGCEEDV